MRYLILALSLLLLPALPALGQISISLPGVDIGINVPVYPRLVRVPGYPVYYDPRADSNYFFYDGEYWVYREDNWYAGSWYNGPWHAVGQEDVPSFVLRVPVRYYRQRPSYFSGWREDAPPRWDEHWGSSWADRHSGWDRWNRRSQQRAAPLPLYQQRYEGDRYPRASQQQQSIRNVNYSYQPHTRMKNTSGDERGRSNMSGRVQQQRSVPQQPSVQQPRSVQPRRSVQQQRSVQPQGARSSGRVERAESRNQVSPQTRYSPRAERNPPAQQSMGRSVPHTARVESRAPPQRQGPRVQPAATAAQAPQRGQRSQRESHEQNRVAKPAPQQREQKSAKGPDKDKKEERERDRR
jgi:hypothetical protein